MCVLNCFLFIYGILVVYHIIIVIVIVIVGAGAGAGVIIILKNISGSWADQANMMCRPSIATKK